MRWLTVVGLLSMGLLVWGAWGLWGELATTQPIEFPHKIHLDFLQCTFCHDRATKDVVAGRPSIEKCLSCHSGGEASSQELKKLQAFGEKGQEIPWKRVWRLPSHVFFSHRTHVMVAKVSCESCHGPMGTLEHPPERPLKRLSMDDCINCHEKREASQRDKTEEMKAVKAVSKRRISPDCNACHR